MSSETVPQQVEVSAHEDAPVTEEVDAPKVAPRARRKVRTGQVVSARMEKTIVVSIQRQVRHPMYGKFIKRTTRLMAHDEEQAARRGDTVRIVETRPLSKHKRWRLTQIVQRAK